MKFKKTLKYMQIINVKIKSFDKKYKSISVHKILNIADFLGIDEIAKLDLPEKKKKITVLRSPHIDKKSQEQFEIKNYKTNIILKIKQINISLLLIEILKNSNLFGVEIEISTNFKGYFEDFKTSKA
jgi:small subunit ribosomal protein S10